MTKTDVSAALEASAGDVQQTATFKGHASGVKSIAFSPDGKLLASASGDRTIKLWDVAAAREAQTLAGHLMWVQSVAFLADGKLLVSGGAEGQVRFWGIK